VTKRRHQAVLRREVFARDKGVCRECGVDTVDLECAYRAAKAQVYGAWRYERIAAEMRLAGAPALIAITQRHRGQIKAIEDRLRRLGFDPGRTFFEADHIVPLEEGGPDALENARLLCVSCHKLATAEHAGRRARRPSKWIPRRAA
jgi:5-methylcytosine-specific restriction endonuclease McrA